MTKDSSLERDYKTQVNEAAGKNSNRVFSNSSLEHAYFLTQKLIHNANHEIKIITRKFDARFYQDLLPDFKSFLEKDKKNKLAIGIMEGDNNMLLKDLKSQFDNQVEIHFFSKAQSQALINKDKDVYINYFVNDTNGFRYEYEDEKIDDGVVSAFANFNDEKSARVLRDFFDKLTSVA